MKRYCFKIIYKTLNFKGSKIVNELMEKAKDKNVKIHFPVDFVTAAAIKDDAETAIVSAKDGIPEDKMVTIKRNI